MCESARLKLDHVVGPRGPLTAADPPLLDSNTLAIRRKAEAAAVRGGLPSRSLEEAYARCALAVERLWQCCRDRYRLNQRRTIQIGEFEMRALPIEHDRSTAPPIERMLESQGVASRAGERFSALYVRPEDPSPDSRRARHRVGALFREPVLKNHADELARYLGRELGIPVPGDGRHSSDWQQYIRECRTPQFLDTITLVYRHLFYHASEETANQWREVVRRIFAEESLAYDMDDVGGVHPAIDREFQRNIASAVAGLESDRYDNVRAFLERASSHLGGEPANYLQAWRSMFSAVETLFALMFPYARLTAEDIDRRLQPFVQRAYAGDASAHSAAQRMMAGFRDWVEGSRIYRHQPGAADPAQPPADVAILAISLGASLLRWLGGLDEDRPADRLRLVHRTGRAEPGGNR
jgi:hypothetical protein